MTIHTIYDMKFRRKFSVNPYKTLKMPLCAMSFAKDWLHTDRGDPYPLLERSGEGSLTAATGDGCYRVANASSATAAEARLLGQHFPYASYALTLDSLVGEVGFRIDAAPGGRSAYTAADAPRLYVWLAGDGAQVRIGHALTVGGQTRGEVVEPTVYPFTPGMQLIVTCRGRFFDIYLDHGRKPTPCLTLDLPEFSEITLHGTFVNATASLWYRLRSDEQIVTSCVEGYLDGGISHADIKPIRYEDGTPMMEGGRLFLTMSSRLEAGGYQSVISWNPSTCDFKLEGAIFLDCGDDRWCADVAASILYDRASQEWLVWSVAFSHGHILCHGRAQGDLRYGISVVDVELMPCEQTVAAGDDELRRQAGVADGFTATLSDDRLWLAKTGDEDPDFVYDREAGKWYMIICRGVSEGGKNRYRYFLFESEHPFSGYRYVDNSRDGATTGGSLVRVGGKLCLICGSRFDARAQYDIYVLPDLSQHAQLRCDYDDGGFRGWGTVIPVPCGSRTKYMWITFDRHGGSSYNWSYGNLYVYESDLMNPGSIR